MQVTDLLAALTADIDATRQEVADLRAWLAEAERKLTDLQVEGRAVENALRRYAAPPPNPVTEPDGGPSWHSLSRVDAIERLLRHHGPLHLTEIQKGLVDRGCEWSAEPALSASLTSLHRRRGSVVGLGKGRWDYAYGTEEVAGAAGTEGATPPATPTNDPTADTPRDRVKLELV